MAFSASAQQLTNFDELAKKNTETTNIDTVGWVYNGNLILGINQGILHNWSAGGELASMTLNGLFNGSLIRYHHRAVWTTNLDAAYGLFYAYSNSFVPRKTDDRIDLTSKYGHKLSETGNLYFTGLFNAKTQFTKAYSYDVPEWDTFSTSKFLSPLYLTIAPGLEYRKGSQISVFFSPAAVRLTFVDAYYTNRSPIGAFGVEKGKTFRFEIGAYLSARYEKELNANITYRGRLDMYSNYLAKDQFKEGVLVRKDSPGNIDILLDNAISFKFYKYFSLSVGLLAIYDNDVPYSSTYLDAGGAEIKKEEPIGGLGWWQLKQFMTFGFNYKF